MDRRQLIKRGLEAIVLVSVPLFSSCSEKNPMQPEPEGPNYNSVVKDGIEYYLQTDKREYALGENVEMLFRITNKRDEEINFKFAYQQQITFLVEKDGSKIWGWPTRINPAESYIYLQPKDYREYIKEWDMIYLNNGTLITGGNFKVTGYLNSPHGVPVSVPIDIYKK